MWLVLISSAAAGQESKKLYLIVTRPSLVQAARELADYRAARGYQVVVGPLEQVMEDPASPPRPEQVTRWVEQMIRSSVGQAGSPPEPAVLLLVGDETESVDETPPWRLPSFRRPLYRWRAKQRETFTSDSIYGDRDGDGLPDIPVGRLPVRSGAEVRAYLNKLIAYESREGRPEDLRAVVWLGIPGYDPGSDAMMTPVGMEAVNRYLPPVLTPWWLSGDPRWPCWLPPEEQPRRFLAELAAGSAFSFFGGHGSETHAIANVAKPTRTVMTIEDLAHLPSRRPAAPLAFLACTIGRFEWEKGPCLAEAMWSHPGGPVVVAAASTESHPLTNYYNAIGLARILGNGFRTFGEWWVAAQRVGFREHSPLIEPILKNAEGKLEPQINVDRLRRDHPLMYNILGDPACRLRLPNALTVSVSREGARLVVRTELPMGVERVRVDLLRPRQQATSAPSAPPASAEGDADAYRRRLEEFNHRVVPLTTASASAGPLVLTCTLPAKMEPGDSQAIIRLAGFGANGGVWAGVAGVPPEQGGDGR